MTETNEEPIELDEEGEGDSGFPESGGVDFMQNVGTPLPQGEEVPPWGTPVAVPEEAEEGEEGEPEVLPTAAPDWGTPIAVPEGAEEGPEGAQGGGAPSAGGAVPDVSEMTVGDALAHAEAHPDQAQAMLDAEQAGKNRTTLVSGLQEQLGSA